MQKLSLVDFSGGLLEGAEAPEDFSIRQVAQLDGFVFDSEQILESQWACQRVSSRTDILAVFPLDWNQWKFIVALTTDGSLLYAARPSDTATSTQTLAHTWVTLSGYTANPDFRMIGRVRWPAALSANKPALLFHSKNGTTPAAIVFPSDTPGVLSVSTISDFYPTSTTNPETGGQEFTSGKMPRGSCGHVWSDTLFIGDVHGRSNMDQNFSASNTQLQPSGVWASRPAAITTFDPAGPARFAEPGARVVGMEAIDIGMFIFTTGGVILLRGDVSNYSRELFKQDAGASIKRENLTGHRQYHCTWPELGVVAWVDTTGSVFISNGAAVRRVDEVGPKSPASAFANDHVAAYGPYLFLARGNDLYCFRKFADDGVWSKLVTPGSGFQVQNMMPMDSSLYFTHNGSLYRYAFEMAAERGMVAGTDIEQAITTRTFGAPDGYQKVQWRKFGLRAQSLRDAMVSTVTVAAGPIRTGHTVPSTTYTLDMELDGLGNYLILPATGAASETFSAKVSFIGHVRLNELAVWHTGTRPAR